MGEEVPTDVKFAIECPESDCTYQFSGNSLADVADHAYGHKKHTDHEVQWINADFGFLSENYIILTGFELSCKVCSATWSFDDEESAYEFAAEHEEYTDHRPMSPRKALDKINADSDTDIIGRQRENIKQLIKHLEPDYQGGVPVNIILSVMRNSELSLDKVNEHLDYLRRKGEIYEPGQDRVVTI